MKNSQNQIGTITWAINVAKAGQSRAIKRISKNKKGVQRMHGLTKYAKTIISVLIDSADARYNKGYVLLTSEQFSFATGSITKPTANFYNGKKIIVGIDTITTTGNICLMPIR